MNRKVDIGKDFENRLKKHKMSVVPSKNKNELWKKEEDKTLL